MRGGPGTKRPPVNSSSGKKAGRSSWGWRRRRLPLLLLWTCACVLSVAVAVPDDPLQRWLWNLEIDLPDQSFQESIWSVKLKGMVCTHFGLAGVSSHTSGSDSNNEEDDPSISVRVKGLVATCHGTYSSMGNTLGGSLKATVTEKPTDDDLRGNFDKTKKDDDIRLKVTFPSSSEGGYRMATSAKISECVMTALEVSSLRFSGSLSADVLQMFTPLIESSIQSALSGKLCDAVRPPVDDLLDQAIRSSDDIMRRWVSEEKKRNAERQRHNGTDNSDDDDDIFLSWQHDFTNLAWGLRTFDDVLGAHVNRGFLPSPYEPSSLSTFSASTQTQSQQNSSCMPSFWTNGVKGLVEQLESVTDDGAFRVPLPPGHNSYTYEWKNDEVSLANLTVTMESISVWGLDSSLETLSLARPYGHRSLSTMLGTKSGLNATVRFNITVDVPSSNPSEKKNTLSERLDWTVRVDDPFEFRSLVRLDVNRRWLHEGKITVAMLAGCHTDVSPWDGATWAIDEMFLQKFRPTAVSFANLQRDPSSLEGQLDSLLNDVLNLFFVAYSDLVSDSLVGLLDGPLRTLLHDSISDFVVSAATSFCDNNVEAHGDSHHRLVHFDTSPLYDKVQTFFDRYLLNVDILNRDLRCSSEVGSSWPSASGALSTQRNIENKTHDDDTIVFPWPSNVTYLNDFKLGLMVQEISVSHLDRIQKLALLKPEIDHYNLKSEIELGPGPSQDDDPGTTVSSVLTFQPQINGRTDYTIQLVPSLTFDHTRLAIGASLRYDMYTLWNTVTIEDLYTQPFCSAVVRPLVMETVGQQQEPPGIQWYDMDIVGLGELQQVSLGILVENSGNSDNDFDDSKGGSDTTVLWNETFALTADEDDNNLYPAELRIMTKQLLRSLQYGGNRLLPLWLKAVDATCRSNSSLDTDDVVLDDGANNPQPRHREVLWVVMGIVAVSIFAITVYWAKGKGQFLHSLAQVENDLSSSPASNSMMEPLLSDHEFDVDIDDGYGSDETNDDQDVEDSPHSPPSLFTDPSISMRLRVGIPVMLILTTATLISSHATIGANLFLMVTSEDSVYETSSIESFSLFGTVKDLWDAKIYTLMVLVLFFSGIWPYIKLVSMGIFFVTPPWEGVQQRSNRLNWLDYLGAYSMFDAYIEILLIVAFHFHIVVTDGLTIDVVVLPEYGSYAFIVATFASIIVGHTITHLHETTTMTYNDREAEQEVGRQLSNKDDIVKNKNIDTEADHAKQMREPLIPLSMESDGNGGTLVTTGDQSMIILRLCLWLLSAIMITIGISVNTFRFQVTGITGTIIGPAESSRPFSVLGVGKALPNSVPDYSVRGAIFMEVLYMMFAVGAPLGTIILKAVLTALELPQFQPYSASTLSISRMPRAKKFLKSLVIVLDGWNAIDVWFFAIVVTLWQMPQFASFLVGDKCDYIDEKLSNFFDKPVDCFDLNTVIEPPLAYLAIGLTLSFMARRVPDHFFLSSRLSSSSDVSAHETVQPQGLESATTSLWPTDS